jgi:hypothetical protein
MTKFIKENYLKIIMGITAEYNPDLALRDADEFKKGNRKKEECIPKNLEKGKEYFFLKKGQRHYHLKGEIPLVKTSGDENITSPIASIIILEAAHFLLEGEVYTKGKYKVIDVFNQKENKVHFDGYRKIN